MILSSTASSSMKGAVVPIASFTVTNSTTNDITFSNIPQVYNDLYLIFDGRRTDVSRLANFFVSPISASMPVSPQSTTIMEWALTGALSYSYVNQDAQYAGIIPSSMSAPNNFGVVTWECFDYTNSNVFKTCLSRSAADVDGDGRTRLTVGLARTLNPITTVIISTFNGSIYFAPQSRATLYGIRGAGQ